MKKILSLLIAVAFVASASAQVKVQEDFESGDFGKVKPWVKESAKIVEGTNGSSYAMEARNGFFYDMYPLTKGEVYKITADVKYLWGDNEGFMLVQDIDPKSKKLVDRNTMALPKPKEFKTIELKYKVRETGYHRVVINPKGCYQFDNLKVEKIQ